MDATLEKYLREHNIKPSAFSRIARISPAFFTKHKNGRPISLYYARKIEQATEGQIKANELLFGSPSSPQAEPAAQTADK